MRRCGRGHSVCVLEREPRPGMATSTHNSQVIHAGMYYPAGSLKAKHCVAGPGCFTSSAPATACRTSGAASSSSRRTRARCNLERILAKGEANGVEGLRLVDRAFVAAREPHVRAHAALFSPNTGILSAEALVQALARQCRDAGAFVLPGSPMIGADVTAEGDDAADAGRSHSRARWS